MLETLRGLPKSYEIRHPDIAEIRVFTTAHEVAVTGGFIILDFVRRLPTASITYATGATMEPVYEYMTRTKDALGVDFSQTKAFHLDERFPCAPTDPAGFAHFINVRVVQPLGIPADHAFFWNGMASDPVAEANRYNRLLGQNQINFAILGIGPPGRYEPGKGGHIAFNEAGTSFDLDAHYVPLLSEETLARDRIDRAETVPDGALTQGIANILRANHILLLAYGFEKGRSLYYALHGPITPNCPASALRLLRDKQNVHIYIDQMAADALQS